MKRFIEDSTNTPPPFDILFNHLSNAYRLLNDAYLDLVNKKTIYCKPPETKTWHIENFITEDLVDIAEDKSLAEGQPFTWINEAKNLKKKNRIDIGIVYHASLGREKILGIECKHLLENKKNNYYITGGVNRFATGYYSSQMPIGGMLSYVEKSTIKNVVTDIQIKLKSTKLKDASLTIGLDNTYVSIHDRKAYLKDKPRMIRNIKVYHIFLDFNNLIDRK